MQIISFGIIAALDSAGLLIHQAIDTSSAVYQDLVNSGVKPDVISVFRYPELPRIAEPVFAQGWEYAMDRNVSFIVNRMNERVLAGQSIETLLAVVMFVMMGIVLERSRIADELRYNPDMSIADRFDEATVMFADIVGFTKLSSTIPAETLVQILDDIFRRFDRIALELELEKIKTIGDCYMMACGLPEQRRRDHARIAGRQAA